MFFVLAVPIKLHQVDLETARVLNPINIRTSLSNFLPTFKEELFELDMFRIYRSSIVLLILEMKCNAEKFLEDETVPLRTQGVGPNSRVSILI